MTLRLLEDGDHRLQEDSVMNYRNLQNGYQRLYEDLVSGPLLESSIVSAAILEESGRLLEDGHLRTLQDGGTRDNEDALCASCLNCNCKVGLSGLNITAIAPNDVLQVSFTCNLLCGNYQGSRTCDAYFQFAVVVPLTPPPSRIVWESGCYHNPLPCGNVYQIKSGVGGTLHSGAWYQIQVYAWDGTACTGWPAVFISQDFQCPLFS